MRQFLNMLASLIPVMLTLIALAMAGGAGVRGW